MKMSLKITQTDHVQGSADAAVELIEYADYQCPYCRQAYYILREVKRQLGNDLKLVFRNFPLPELHPYAVHAAIAAEIANDYGKFWEMHDMLFENQEYLDDSHLLSYAKKIGLDPSKFEAGYEDDTYYNKVNSDYTSGIQNGVEGTPTFFINGEKFEGNWMNPSFIDYLKSMIKK